MLKTRPRFDPLRLLLMTTAICLAIFVSLVIDRDWVYDTGRAVDRAGLYLFLMSPLYAGMSCLITMHWNRAWSSIALQRSMRILASRTPWLWIAGQGIALHAVVLTSLWAVARYHSAVGDPDPFAALVQFLSIMGFSALGGLTGTIARSELTAVSLGGGLLLLNVAVPSLYFRSISDVGTGDSDLVLTPYANGPLVLKALVFVGLIVAAFPVRRFSARFVGVQLLIGLAISSGAVYAGYTYTGPRTEQATPESVNWACVTEQAYEICGPQPMLPLMKDVRRLAQPAAAALEEVGIEAPRRAVITTDTSQASPTVVTLELGPSGIRLGQALPTVIRAYTGAPQCDANRDATYVPDESVLIARATLSGWLQYRLGGVVEGSFPSMPVENLGQLPVAEQFQMLRRLYAMTQSCANSIPLESLLE